MSTWYYEHRGEQHGPVSEAELRMLVQNGTITKQTNVWCDGMADWQPAGRVLDFPAPDPAPSSPSTPPGGTPGGASPFAPPHAPPVAFTGKIENHLIKAILVTLFCCLPLGIVSIVFAAQVDGKARAGDVAEAQRLSDEAAKWAKWGFIAGLVVYGLYALVLLFSAVSGY